MYDGMFPSLFFPAIQAKLFLTLENTDANGKMRRNSVIKPAEAAPTAVAADTSQTNDAPVVLNEEALWKAELNTNQLFRARSAKVQDFQVRDMQLLFRHVDRLVRR